MNTEALIVEKHYDAQVAKVWAALTDAKQMQQWYFDIKEFKAEPGFEFSFTAGHEDKKYIHHCKVIEVIPNQKLSYSWRYQDYPGYSVVSFELSEENGGTLLTLTHTGLESFPADSPDFARSSFHGGWTHITGISLKDFVEKK